MDDFSRLQIRMQAIQAAMDIARTQGNTIYISSVISDAKTILQFLSTEEPAKPAVSQADPKEEMPF